jgi:hypothetical protein
MVCFKVRPRPVSQPNADRGAGRRFVSAGVEMAEDDLIVMEKARVCSGRSDNQVPSNQEDGWQAARGGKPFPARSNSNTRRPTPKIVFPPRIRSRSSRPRLFIILASRIQMAPWLRIWLEARSQNQAYPAVQKHKVLNLRV